VEHGVERMNMDFIERLPENERVPVKRWAKALLRIGEAASDVYVIGNYLDLLFYHFSGGGAIYWNEEKRSYRAKLRDMRSSVFHFDDVLKAGLKITVQQMVAEIEQVELSE
jgi:hypothetical protein